VRQERRDAARVGLLVAAQVVAGVALNARVDAAGVAVPDLDVGAGDDRARRRVLDREDDLERQPRPLLADVVAPENRPGQPLAHGPPPLRNPLAMPKTGT